MTEPPKTKDLIVLVPDADMEYAIQALLPRHQALDIRPVTFDIRRHMQRDAGCRSDCHNFLRLFLNDYQYALVLFDHEGCGREQMTRLELETDVEGRLKANGWGDRCAVSLFPRNWRHGCGAIPPLLTRHSAGVTGPHP